MLPSVDDDHLTYRPFAKLRELKVADTLEVVEEPRLTRGGVQPELGVDALATFPPELVADYRVAVAVSSLVVLAGPSGSGKTRLTSAFAQATATKYMLTPVRPDWRTNEDLLGYLPPFGGDFVPSPFTEFLREAADEWRTAEGAGREAQSYHACLDEMNLARPEYYMAEVLSRMELEGDDRQLHLYDAAEERGLAPG